MPALLPGVSPLVSFERLTREGNAVCAAVLVAVRAEVIVAAETEGILRGKKEVTLKDEWATENFSERAPFPVPLCIGTKLI